MDQTNGKIFIGIRAEDKSYWERRTPLPPQDCKKIMEQHSRLQFIVQPSSKRIFTDKQYAQVGCQISEDLSPCELIVCIKEIPIEKYIPGKTYLHWSHTIKAQHQNMHALDKMLELNIRHIDYEKILNSDGVNITAFPYAGIAGVITFLSEFGKLLLRKSISTPFLLISPSYAYYSMAEAYQALERAGRAIQEQGMPSAINLPIIIGVLGSNGRCGKGSMQALQNLPVEIIKPDDMKNVVEDKDNPKHQHTIYVVPFKTTDLVRFADNYDKEFTSKDYYQKPQNYDPVFHQKYLPYLTALIVDIYWDYKYPRYITNTQMKELVQTEKSRLQAICDVTCDLQGCVQFLKKYTSPDEPVYFYDPINETVHDKFNPHHPEYIMYMSIDFLPSQLAYDASQHFGRVLQEIIPQIAYSDPTKSLSESGLPKYLQDAVITLHGQLTPKFKYIDHLRKMNAQLQTTQNFQEKKAMKKIHTYLGVKLKGHLFDSLGINKIIDTLTEGHCKFNVVTMEVGESDISQTEMQIQLFSKDKGNMMDVLTKIQDVSEEFNIQMEY